jgi:hypothetical protein
LPRCQALVGGPAFPGDPGTEKIQAINRYRRSISHDWKAMHYICAVFLVVVVAACGGGGSAGHLPDAAVGSADPSVTLTVTDLGAPKAGVHVYFVAADGTPVKTVDTGADGSASAVIAEGGSVTALNPFALQAAPDPGNGTLVGYLGVKPGDHLVLSNSDRNAVSFTLTTEKVTDATDYDVATTCGNQSISPAASGAPFATGTVELEGCQGAADIAIVASKFDTQTNVSTPLLGLFHADATVDGGAVSLTDSYAALTQLTVTYMNSSLGTPSRVLHAPIIPRGPIGPFPVHVTGSGGTLTGTIAEPTMAAATSAVTTEFDLTSGTHKVIEWGPSAASYTLDLAGVAVRGVVGRPSYDFATGTVVWSETADGATPDSVTTLVGANRTASSRKWNWLIIAPYTAGKIVLPKLPTDVADWTPVAGDTVTLDHVSLLTVTGGYDALRARNIDVGQNDDKTLISGSSGRFVSFDSEGSLPITGVTQRAAFGLRR